MEVLGNQYLIKSKMLLNYIQFGAVPEVNMRSDRAIGIYAQFAPSID